MYTNYTGKGTVQKKCKYKKSTATKVFYLVKITKCTRWCRESLLSYCTYKAFHAKAEPGLLHYPFQNHLQTIRAVAKCHKVRRLTWRYIWMDSYLFQNKREKRSQPQKSKKKKKEAFKNEVLLIQGNSKLLDWAELRKKKKLQLCHLINKLHTTEIVRIAYEDMKFYLGNINFKFLISVHAEA